MVVMNDDILQIKNDALEKNVPIMQDEGIEFLLDFIRDNNIENILEIGTAVGYSAIRMASIRNNIKVTSIERDEKRYEQAVKNVDRETLSNRITLIFADAMDVNFDKDKKFDLIFIDAAKGQNINFFNKFQTNLNQDGYIITDNLKFHGLVATPLEEIESRNVRGLVRKIRSYIEFLKSNQEFETKFLDVGDGISISRRNYSD